MVGLRVVPGVCAVLLGLTGCGEIVVPPAKPAPTQGGAEQAGRGGAPERSDLSDRVADRDEPSEPDGMADAIGTPDPCDAVVCLHGACDGGVCECEPGWAGAQCEVDVEDDVDHCAAAPCVNGACVDEVDGFTCQCWPGWEGLWCESNVDECAGAACAYGACVDDLGGYRCDCEPGWTGPLCDVDIDDCAVAPCAHGHCVDAVAGFICACEAGWVGDLCDVDEDDCAGAPCAHGECVDGLADFSCECSAGWTGTACDVDIDDCAGAPCGNGACVDLEGDFACACDPGWTGLACDVNIDDCAASPCAQGACVDGLAGFTCACDVGWTGALCDVDVDDCAGEPCVNGTCVDGAADFACSCPPGWTGDLCEVEDAPEDLIQCLVGQLAIDDALDVVNGYEATGVFEGLVGVSLDLHVAFEVLGSTLTTYDDWFGEELVNQLELGALEVTISGGPAKMMALVFAPAFDGTTQEIELVSHESGQTEVDLGNLVSPAAAEYWGLEFSRATVPLPLDAAGYPVLAVTPKFTTNVMLRRYQTGTPLMTDFAMGSATLQLTTGAACL